MLEVAWFAIGYMTMIACVAVAAIIVGIVQMMLHSQQLLKSVGKLLHLTDRQ